MALTLIEQVRVYIGDTITGYYYKATGDYLLSDDEIEFFLERSNQNSYQAAKLAAQAAIFQIISIPSREKTGEIEIWNDFAKLWVEILKMFLKENPAFLQSGLMPYAAGISYCDMYWNVRDCDVVKSPLTQINSTCCDLYANYNHCNCEQD